MSNLDRANEPRFQGRQGPGLGMWNYPDALFTGKGGMTDVEYRLVRARLDYVTQPCDVGLMAI